MKRLIYLMILICSLIVGCSPSSDKSSEVTDDNNTKMENKKEKVDISEMIVVLRPTLKMMADGTTYDELFEDENLSWLAYSIILDRDLHDEDDVSMSEVGNSIYAVIDKNDMNKHLKAINANFDNRKISEIAGEDFYTFKDLFEADMYAAMPADGEGMVEVKVLEAYDNGDGTYSAIVTSQIVYDIEGVDNSPIETYKVSLVKNSSSGYKYSITNIEK